MQYLTRFLICATLSVALLISSMLIGETIAASTNESLSGWEKRIPGRPVVLSYEPTDDLRRHCPDFVGELEDRGVRGGFTPECEARLDDRFFDEIPPLMPFEAKDNRITWRYAFDQPMLKRKIVLDALSNPECLKVPEGAAQEDLAERCRVDAIADYAVLKYQCGSGFYRMRGRIENGIELPWWYVFPFERLYDNESYWRKRWGIERAYFQYAWITAKCAGLPSAALASLRVFENTMEFGGEPAVGEENWWWAEQGFEAYELMGVAQQLSSNFARTKYGYETRTLSVWQRVQPLMAELIQIKDPGVYSNAAEEKAARLKHFISASTWMRLRRTDVNESWLQKQIGEYTNEELEEAGAAATEMMTNQEVGTNWQ